MENTNQKPSIDPVTGCIHIKNLFLNGCKFRVCSDCESVVPDNVEESNLNFCYNCGGTFDHLDDDAVMET